MGRNDGHATSDKGPQSTIAGGDIATRRYAVNAWQVASRPVGDRPCTAQCEAMHHSIDTCYGVPKPKTVGFSGAGCWMS